VTGITSINIELAAKRLELLHELRPGTGLLAVLFNPANPRLSEPFVKDMQTAASTIGRKIELFNASTSSEIDTAFARLVDKRADGLLISPETFYIGRRLQLVTLSARHALPTVYPNREFMDVGGLMSYGANLAEQYRQVGIYAGRILKGEKPADLPVVRPTKLELIINIQTAKTIGANLSPCSAARRRGRSRHERSSRQCR
jgi:putative ABC transport system substrate-binding protein